AIIAASPKDLTERLERLLLLLEEGQQSVLDEQGGLFLGYGTTPPRVGFLFPGQGSPSYLAQGLLRRRFDFVQELYRRANLSETGDGKNTAIAQPAIVTASLAALHVLQKLGISAEVGLGHSLGELSALHWASVFDAETLLALARVRGSAMASLGDPTGTMVSLLAPPALVKRLIQNEPVVIAGLNAPCQVTISGDTEAIARVAQRARVQKVPVVPLKVSHAFHSLLVAQAATPLSDYMQNVAFQPLQKPVVSTVTGSPIPPEQDLKTLLCRQITAPVLFTDALNAAATQVDLFIEVGPGKVLSGLASEGTSVPAFSIDSDGPSAKGLCQVIGAAFASGIPLQLEFLTAHRFSRPFDLNWQPHFLANPCEQAPLPTKDSVYVFPVIPVLPAEPSPTHEQRELAGLAETISIIDLLRQLVADRTELPKNAVNDDHRMLSDLHLNSITVGQIVSETARGLGLLPPTALTEYADATLSEIAQALTELKQ